MPTFPRTHRVTPWGGTTQDVGDVARAVHRLVSEATGGEFSFSVNINRPSREDEYDTPEDFEQHVGTELRSFTTITISARDSRHPTRVDVFVCFYNNRSGAWLQVKGAAEVSVNGIALALQKMLDTGRRSARHVRWVAWLGVPGVILSWAFALGLGNGQKHGSHVLNHIFGDVGLVLDALALLALLFSVFALPPMELRSPGQPTRIQRFIARPTTWLLGVVVVAAITALLTKLIP